jgi:hypothetical protein
MVQGRKKDHEKNEIVNAMALKSPLGPVVGLVWIGTKRKQIPPIIKSLIPIVKLVV